MRKIFYLLIAFLTLPISTANAHVRYLVEENVVEQTKGLDWSYLFSVFNDSTNIFLMIITIVAVLILWLIYEKVPFVHRKFHEITSRADSYTVFTPWMLRLSLGIALIGSGTAGNLVSPVLQGTELLHSIQILLGFFIMAGFLVIPSAIATLGIYFYALNIDFYLLGNFDFAAAAIALLLLNNEKPGIDDLLNLTKFSPFKHLKRFVPIMLRIGIGGAMIFLALYEKILNPHLSEIIVNDFGLLNVVPVSPEMWVFSAGIIELFIGLLLLVGFHTRITASVAFIVLSLSFFYFNEEVYSHITLFGILSVLFVTQGGKWSIDKARGIVNKDFV